MTSDLAPFGTSYDKTHRLLHPASFGQPLHVKHDGAQRYEYEPVGLSITCHAFDDKAMLQSYPESPLSPFSSQGATADTVPTTNTDAPSNITNPQPSAARKPRVALACKRCKRRKQRVR